MAASSIAGAPGGKMIGGEPLAYLNLDKTISATAVAHPTREARCATGHRHGAIADFCSISDFLTRLVPKAIMTFSHFSIETGKLIPLPSAYRSWQ